MARISKGVTYREKVVVVLDICSSSRVLEDLLKTENLHRWHDLILWLRRYLVKQSHVYGFKSYKFLGDGWIVLFDEAQLEILDFLRGLCSEFQKQFERRIVRFLDSPPSVKGLTFGMDRGTLGQILMNNRNEYFGRAINIACRLQGSIKERDKRPQYKLLVSRHTFYGALLRAKKKYKCQGITRSLRNVGGGEHFRCVKVSLLDRP